jgi:hypothetical protein
MKSHRLLSYIKYTLTILTFLLVFKSSFSQEVNPHLSINPKGKFYFYWGYNRGFFSKSDIHAHGEGYDFTIYDAVAKDRPEKPSLVYVNPDQLTIPQFNIRAGYYLTKRWAISVGYDHMKYVMQNGQTAKVSGVITKEVSEKYAGSYLNQEMKIESDFLKFEHTDGLNIVTIDIEHYIPLYTSKRQRFKLEATLGSGGIWVAPRSDLRVFGKGLNNDYHIAGYTWTGKAGFRINAFKRFFFQAETRGGYISLPSVLVANGAPEMADHNFTFLEFSTVIGVYF